jgi:hypothetical protein
MAWEIPGCNGGDCCKFYGPLESPFRVVTNGHEFKIQEKRTTFWRGRQYWEDVKDDITCAGDLFVQHYATLEAAGKALKNLERENARAFGNWKPVDYTENG